MSITNENNMDLMARYPDGAFDLAIVDPPYGIGFGEFNRTNKDSNGVRHKANKYKNADWDSEIPNIEYFNELRRVSKNQIIWGGNYYFDILGNSKGLICWYKKQPVKNFSDCEYAWNSLNKPARVFEFAYYGNIQGNTTADKKIHPTQKPVSLYEWILMNYAKEGDKILDTHLGSGSIALACHNLGFELTACELDPEYYAQTMKRIKQHTAQMRIF